MGADRRGRHASRPQRTKRCSVVALGKAAAGLIRDQTVMAIDGGFELKKRLQQRVKMRRRFQVLAANDMRDAVARIIEN